MLPHTPQVLGQLVLANTLSLQTFKWSDNSWQSWWISMHRGALVVTSHIWHDFRQTVMATSVSLQASNSSMRISQFGWSTHESGDAVVVISETDGLEYVDIVIVVLCTKITEQHQNQHTLKKRIKLIWWGYDVQMWIEIHVHATKNGESVKFISRLMVTWADGIHITFVSVTALSVCYLSPFLPNDKNGLIGLLVNVTFLNEWKTAFKKTMQSSSTEMKFPYMLNKCYKILLK